MGGSFFLRIRFLYIAKMKGFPYNGDSTGA